MGDDTSFQEELELSEEGHVFIFDRRKENGTSTKLSLGGLFDFQEFRGTVKEVCCFRTLIVGW